MSGEELKPALKNAALAYGPNGSGGMRVVIDFTNPAEAMALFEILSEAADDDAPECYQCGEVYGENPNCPVHGSVGKSSAWMGCHVGACRRHKACMYRPCRNMGAIA